MVVVSDQYGSMCTVQTLSTFHSNEMGYDKLLRALYSFVIYSTLGK